MKAKLTDKKNIINAKIIAVLRVIFPEAIGLKRFA
jgi:hypothetical protein